jgi:hypothetical protein
MRYHRLLAPILLFFFLISAGPCAAQELSRQYLQRIVAEELVFTPAADSPTMARLRQVAGQLADAGQLAGAQVMTFDDVMKFYANPARGIYGAALCLPLLEEPAKGKLAGVLRTELQRQLAREGLARGLAGEIAGGPAATPQRYRWNGNTGSLWDAALAAEAYGRATGDWQTPRELWPNLRQALLAAPRTEQSLFWTNLEFRQPARALEAAGCIAAIRLAQRFDDQPMASGLYDRLAAAASAMLAEVDEAAARDVPEIVRLGQGRQDLMYFPFLHLGTPQTLRILRDHRRPQIVKIIEGFEQRRPWHHMNSFNHGMQGSGEEGMFQPPWVAFQAFSAKALVCDVPADALARRLPWPNVWASMRSFQDPCHLQNLWTLLAVESAASWAMDQ